LEGLVGIFFEFCIKETTSGWQRGRNLFRILYQRDDIRLAAINDIADHKALEYLLRFDECAGAQWVGGGSCLLA
jgi:hypothetical protein